MPLPDITTRLGNHQASDASFFDDALCPQTDPEIFFPDKGSSPKEAKSICGRCEVADRCLQWAIDNSMEFGIWGGLSARERRNLIAGRVVDERLLARLQNIRIPPAAADDLLAG
jgi:hypothetical protein